MVVHLLLLKCSMRKMFILFWTLSNLLLVCTSGLNLAGDVGPVLALFNQEPSKFGCHPSWTICIVLAIHKHTFADEVFHFPIPKSTMPAR